MSSVGRNGNRFNSVRSAIVNATAATATTQEQLKAIVVTTTDQQKTVNKRVEDLEGVVQALKTEVQTLKTDLAAVKATTPSASGR
jgi:predicted  nucleic acid-binding Zn-ribbon protein